MDVYRLEKFVVSSVVNLPPSGYKPDELSLYFLTQSPPFGWVVRRGQGFVIAEIGLTFQDGLERTLELTIGKYPTYPGFYFDVRFKSDLWLEVGFVDGKPPYIGRVETYLPTVRKEV